MHSVSRPHGAIKWREWSRTAFDEAAQKNMLVLLDLSAVWCHWCHVMDDTTYSDKEVADTINESFIPVRVDIDERPDISERYNRGGFPTTAFLSDRAESVWGATYIPPGDMKRIMRSILAAKASGEIDRALQKNRLQQVDVSRRPRPGREVEPAILSSMFEDIFSIYDVEFGGFGTQPKFPHPDVLDLMVSEYAFRRDKDISKAVQNTLDRMADGIFDHTEGGLFRYSVTRDWKTPHYEKMLETNLGFVRNLAHACIVLDNRKYADLARKTVAYILGTLRNLDSGGFYGSQAADERFYKLSRAERATTHQPPVDKRVFAGWNAQAVHTLIEAGAILGEAAWIEAGAGAWKYALRKLWNPSLGLIRHMEGREDYLFEDQVEFLEAGLAMLEVAQHDDLVHTMEALISGVEKNYASADGGYGDVLRTGDAIGELDSARRSLAANSRWARGLALLGVATHNESFLEKAEDTLASFTMDEVESYGLFGASFMMASRTLQRGPALVEVHGSEDVPWRNPLWIAAKRSLDFGTIAILSAEERSYRPYAVICTPLGCSSQVFDADTLTDALRHRSSDQV